MACILLDNQDIFVNNHHFGFSRDGWNLYTREVPYPADWGSHYEGKTVTKQFSNMENGCPKIVWTRCGVVSWVESVPQNYPTLDFSPTALWQAKNKKEIEKALGVQITRWMRIK